MGTNVIAETVQTVIACCFHNYADKAHEDNLSRVLFFMLINIPIFRKSFLVKNTIIDLKNENTHFPAVYKKSKVHCIL